MIRSVSALWLSLVIVLSSSVTGLAQPNHDVAHWLDRDVTMLFNVRDVATTYDRIKSLGLFSNPRFFKAIEMLSDDRLPIVEPESFEQIQLRLLELESSVREIKQISFAVHDLDEKQFHWSLFIRAESDVLDELHSGMITIDGQLRKTVQSKDNEGITKSEDAGKNPVEPGFANLGWSKIRRVEEWLILSNHLPFIEALADRTGDEAYRSLGKSRKYRAIQKSKLPLDDRDGLITIYGKPVRMRYFFPYSTKEEWELSKIDEMPACRLNLVITDSAEGDQMQPIALADAIVKFTQPTAGQAKQYESYRAVEVPPLAVEPIEFLAFSRDEAAVYTESARLFDAKHGQGAADTQGSNQFKDIGLDNLTDAIPRRRAFYEMRFINESQTPDRPGLVSLERLHDNAAAQRFASAVTRFANGQRDQKLTRQEDGPSVLWTIPAEQFEQNSGLGGFDRRRHSKIDFLNVQHDAYALTDQWWVQGDMPAVQDQVNLLAHEEAEDHGQPVRDLVKDLTRRLGSDEQPFMIKYFTNNAWQENLNNVEQQYANANLHPVDLKLKFTQLSGNRIVMGLGEDAKNSGEIGGGTIEFQVQGLQTDSPGGNQDPPTQRLNLNMSKIRVMMPMKLAERNEDGHRIELKRREDLETAIRVMILKCVSESFPRQMFLYTQNENHIRIMMGAYPEVIRKGE